MKVPSSVTPTPSVNPTASWRLEMVAPAPYHEPPPPSAPPRGSQAPLAHHEMMEEAEEDLLQEVQSAWRENVGMRRAGGCVAVLLLSCMLGLRFVPHAWKVGQQLSEPQLLFRGINLTGSGELVQVCWPCLPCGRAGCGYAGCAGCGCDYCGCCSLWPCLL